MLRPREDPQKYKVQSLPSNFYKARNHMCSANEEVYAPESPRVRGGITVSPEQVQKVIRPELLPCPKSSHLHRAPRRYAPCGYQFLGLMAER